MLGFCVLERISRILNRASDVPHILRVNTVPPAHAEEIPRHSKYTKNVR